LTVVRVKICGISTAAAARAAAEAGANAIGLIFAPSPRQVTIPQARAIAAALPPFVSTVGVFVDEEQPQIEEVVGACQLDFVQLHGAESPEFCAKMPVPVVKAIRVADSSSLAQIRHYDVAAVLLEAAVPGIAGGSGRTFDWELATAVAHTVRVILSGGLTPDNVQRAINQVRPYAVDVSSGVETDGRKDPEKIRAFIGRVREWEWTHRELEG